MLRRVVLAEDLEPFLGGQGDPHLVCLHRSFHRRDHVHEPFDPPVQQVVLASQVLLGVDRRVVEEGHDLFERESELAVEQHALQPVQVGLGVPAVPGRAVPAGYQQTDLVVVVQGADGDAGQPRDLPYRVAHDPSVHPDVT